MGGDGIIPTKVKYVDCYFIVGAFPFILFALFCFFIPVEELTNHPQELERDRAFLEFIRNLMSTGLLVYSLFHLIGGVLLLKGSKIGFIMIFALSLMGAISMNPLIVPGLAICLDKQVRGVFNVKF